MASLHFLHAVMNCGKSTHLLQVAHNYMERGMKVLLITSSIDDRYGNAKISSRIGLSANAEVYTSSTNMIDLCQGQCRVIPYDCILIDEAQFLTRKQVEQLSEIVDKHNVPVMCYGLRVDAKSQLFEGSAALLALADKLVEMKTVCHCGRKANQIAKIDSNGVMVPFDGPQIEIGGNDRYISMCRKHWTELKNKSHIY